MPATAPVWRRALACLALAALPIALPPGEHTLTAVSGTDVEATHTFTVPEGETRWAVLDYWYYPESDGGSDHVPPSFTFDVFDEQVAFT